MDTPPVQLEALHPRPDEPVTTFNRPPRAAGKHADFDKGSRLFTASWVAALLIFASLTIYGFAPWRDNSTTALPKAQQSAASLIPAVQRETAPRRRAIEDVRVADRTLGRNPQVSEVERASFDDIDPATWRHLLLTMVKDDGGRLDIELLRSRQWIDVSQAKAGGLIHLDLPEMGAVGEAYVLDVKPCPRIKPGKGQVVTGTFVHHSAEVIDLQIEGESKPIGVTSKHPFWSEDRQDFIPAGELREGEYVNAVNGYEGVARVASIVPRAGPQKVYNLEVYGEHVYRVGDSGVLVHNACTPTIKNATPIKSMTTGAKVGGSVRKLSKSQRAAIRSHQKQIKAHQEKLRKFSESPKPHPATVNQSKAIQQKSIDKRIDKLEHQIRTFRKNIDMIKRGEM